MTDALIIVGSIFVLIGGYWLHPPLALIILGGGLMLMGFARMRNQNGSD